MSEVFAGLLGAIVGDALGVPYEFCPKGSFECTGMTGYGTHGQPAGTWSDDSSMLLATVWSLIDNEGKVNLKDIMNNFTAWLYHGRFTPYGTVFDCGGTTSNAIEKCSRLRNNGVSWETAVKACGGTDEFDNGNGSLMRILPLAFVGATSEEVAEVSALTHAHPIAMGYCNLYVNLARRLCRKDGFVVSPVTSAEVKSSGYVVDTYNASLWCLVNSSSYKEAVLKAVNLGADTDTVASVTGGLAGIVYGVGGKRGIPKEWIEQIARIKDIKILLHQFEWTVEDMNVAE